MDTNRLKQLRVLAETKNLRKASDLLGISHTGLHKSMRKLEADLGQKLFFVVGRGLEITPFAKKVVSKIPFVLSQIEDLKDNWVAHRKTFTLGSFEVFTTHALPSLIKQIKNTNLTLREFGPGKLEGAVLDGDVDLGITYAPIARSGLEIYPVSPVKMGMYCRKKTFENTPLQDLPFAAPANPLDETPTTVRGLDGWPDHKIYRKVTYSVELMESALALLREGLAVAYLPKFIASLNNAKIKDTFQLVEIPLPAKFPIAPKKAYIIKRQTDPETDFERQVAKGIRSICSA